MAKQHFNSAKVIHCKKDDTLVPITIAVYMRYRFLAHQNRSCADHSSFGGFIMPVAMQSSMQHFNVLICQGNPICFRIGMGACNLS